MAFFGYKLGIGSTEGLSSWLLSSQSFPDIGLAYLCWKCH